MGQTHVMPDGSVMAGPPMSSYMPNIPGRLDGGPVEIPGYQEGTLGDEVYGPPAPSTPQIPGVQGTADPRTTYYYDIIAQYKVNPDTGEPMDLATAKAIFDADPSLWLPKGNGSTSSDAATYAGIAQRAAEAAMADKRERDFEENRKREQMWSAAVEREKANQEFFNNREALKQARAQLHVDRAGQAMAAWQKGLGTANIPGMQNLDFFNDPRGSARIMGRAPIVKTDPSAVFGETPQWEEGTAPNIPGLEYS